MKKQNRICEAAFEFALRIVRLHQFFSDSSVKPITTQLLRSGTSIGAMTREAQYAESRSDFIHKMKIALKEANETQYWLELLFKSENLNEKQFNSLNSDLLEILKLLTSIVNTAKTNY